MSDTILFLNMFSQYQPPEALQSALSQAAVVAADIDPERRRVETCIFAPEYIPAALLDTAAKEISGIYGLNQLDITATHPADQLSRIEPEELMGLFIAQNSMNRGSLAGAKWQWEQEK